MSDILEQIYDLISPASIQNDNLLEFKSLRKKVGEQEDITRYRAVVLSYGVSAEDIKVEVKDKYILVSGATTTKKLPFSFECPIFVSNDIFTNMDGIKYESKDGITYVYITVKNPEVKQINIEKI